MPSIQSKAVLKAEFKEIKVMDAHSIQPGRPRKLANIGLILDLRLEKKMGWSRVANEYTRLTGDFISKQTCRRRYLEATKKNGS